MHTGQALELALRLSLRFLVHPGRFNAAAQLLDLRVAVVSLAELLLNLAHLLTQKDLALRAVHLVARGRLELCLHGGYGQLATQKRLDPPQPAHRIEDLECLLRLVDAQPQIGRNEIRQAARIFDIRGDRQQLRRHVS